MKGLSFILRSSRLQVVCISFVLLSLFIPQIVLSEEFISPTLSKGIKEYKEENFEEALEFFIKAREEDPSSSVAAFYLGLTYKQTMNLREASKNFRDAVTLKPPVKEAIIELIEVLSNLGELKEAKEWLAVAEKEGIKPAQTAFLKGLILLKEDKNLEAIKAFEASKGLDKTLTQAADFQIAIAYTKEKRFSKARERFRASAIVSPESDLAAFAREYEEAITKRLALERRWRLNLGLAYQYDDNVTLRPELEITGLPTEKEDKAVVATLSTGYTPWSSGPWTLDTQYSFYASRHLRIETYDVMSHTLTVIPGYNLKNSSINLSLSYNYTWVNDQRYLHSISASPQMNFSLGGNHIGQVSFGYSKKEFLWTKTPGGIPIGPDEDRDADLFSISAGWIYPFSEGKGFFNLRYEFSSEDADGKNWSYIGNRGSVNILIPLLEDLKMNIGGEIFYQDYRDVHTVFNIEREDRIYTGSGSLSYKFYKGASLILQYTHIRDDSNIAVYDYKKNVYSGGIEYRF